jgi:uncharacterized membrane protein YfcA
MKAASLPSGSPPLTLLLLLAAGFLGGALNSLAGGGSFIVFPALLAAGVPPVLANASNTYAALPGYVSGVVGYWPHMRAERGRLLAFTVVALVFGYAGAELLLHVSDAQFERAVPWLMLFAVVLFAVGGRLNTVFRGISRGGNGSRVAAGLGLLLLLGLVCLYGGFFNAGLGILLLAVLALGGLTDIHAMNGLKLWVSWVVALIAVIRFALGGSIDWTLGSVALIGVTIGGYVAARFAQRIPQGLLRTLILIYGAGLTAWFFWDTYGAG